MSGKNFKKRSFTTITLDDNETKIRVRKLKAVQFLAEGQIPDVVFQMTASEQDRKEALENQKTVVAMYKVAFLRGVIPTPDFIPVDKEFTHPDDDEVCMNDMNETELVKILNASLGVGGDADAVTFPIDGPTIEKSKEAAPVG